MKNTYHKLLRKLAHFQVEHPYLTVLLLIIITIALYGGVSKGVTTTMENSIAKAKD